MEENVGEKDKIARIALGALTGFMSLTIIIDITPKGPILPDILSPVLGIVSIALLATAYTSKCGLYNALGIDTSE